jgi:ABC-type glycerol-3-phosphate transport system substrate-binding protein
MFLDRMRMLRPSLVALVIAASAVLLAAAAAAQQFDPGYTSGAASAVATPTLDPDTRIVTVHAGTGDDTLQIAEAFAICSASGVGCTVRLMPGIYAVGGLDITSAEGTLAVVHADLQLTGLFAAEAPSRPIGNVGRWSESGDRWPTPVMFTF